MIERKRKVLFLIHTLGGGGAEKALVNLVKTLPQNEWDITVKTVVNTGKYRSDLPKHVRYKSMISLPVLSAKEREGSSGSLLAHPGRIKILVARLYTKLWRLAPSRMLYAWAIGREKYDVEVSFLEGISTKILARRSNGFAKRIAWVHVDLEEQQKSHAVFSSLQDECRAYETFDCIACVSDSVAEAFSRLFPALKEKVAVCHNILDGKEVSELAKEPIDCPDIPVKSDAPLLYSIGRLNWQKGYDRLIEAAAVVRKRGYDFNIVIAGTGTAFGELSQKIANYGLGNHIFLAGYLDNPYSWLTRADLFVAPSRTEGLSTVVAEALVCGCPVLATDCSGMRELLEDSGAGIIVENSTAGLVQGLEMLLGNYKKYIALKEAAQKCGNPLSASRGLTEFEMLVGQRAAHA